MCRGWLVAAALAFGVGACSAGAADPANPDADEDMEAHAEGLETLCNAEARSGGIAVFPFAPKMQTINDWLEQHLTDAYVRELHREKLPAAPLPAQGELLRRYAAAAGLDTCPMAGLIDFLGQLSTVTHADDDCRTSCIARHQGVEVSDLDAACTRGCGG